MTCSNASPVAQGPVPYRRKASGTMYCILCSANTYLVVRAPRLACAPALLAAQCQVPGARCQVPGLPGTCFPHPGQQSQPTTHRRANTQPNHNNPHPLLLFHQFPVMHHPQPTGPRLPRPRPWFHAMCCSLVSFCLPGERHVLSCCLPCYAPLGYPFVSSSLAPGPLLYPPSTLPAAWCRCAVLSVS